ncbi:MAG: SH3 beta-barrel fold-containing protein [Candidatus Thorarchaeota archaeon]
MPSADKDVISSAIEFWQTLYDAGEATVKFTKKTDGTVRIMKCTLDFKRIPPSQHPKSVNMPKILKLLQKSGIIHVYDLEKKEWRSVPFQNVDWLKVGTKQFKVRPFTGRRT